MVIAAVGVVLATPAATAAERCDLPPGFPAHGRLASRDVVVMFRTVPEPITIGQHFAVEAIVCATPAVRGLRVDAQMPEHRHGMNYRARVSATGERRYVAEGLLFHMPGRWQLVFDVERETGTERLTTDLVLE
jgi:hypothetical protein